VGLLALGMAACEQRPVTDTTSNEVKGVAPSGPQLPGKEAQAKAENAATSWSLGKLFARMWRVTKAPEKPALGAMWVFLPNGTMLETSCVETYRVATWSVDPKEPRLLRVVEDREPAFTAQIEELTDQTLKVKQKLTRQTEEREITLTGIEGEVVCPDLR
jgi:hypothetical protein